MTITEKRKIGDIGEDNAVQYLIYKGYTILDRNYLRKWGELDIVAEKGGIYYFVEVKTKVSNFYIQKGDWHRPEDNIHKEKVRRLRRVIQTYLNEKGQSIEVEWEFSAITVVLKRGSHDLYKLEHLENLII